MDQDEWGRDPAVRGMRRIFAAIEAAQGGFLDKLNIGPMDRRLGQWRRMALHLFEKTWADSERSGRSLDEKDVVDLYLHCLAWVLKSKGVVAPNGSLPDNLAVQHLIEER